MVDGNYKLHLANVMLFPLEILIHRNYIIVIIISLKVVCHNQTDL